MNFIYLRRIAGNFSIKGKVMPLISMCCLFLMNQGCQNGNTRKAEKDLTMNLITLAPGHFHAALVQKSMYANVSPTVHVYAPEGPEVEAYLGLVKNYNSRKENPTSWEEKIYTGPDYLEKMLQEKAGNIVVISGNNEKKTEYIKSSVDAGLHVLADKPMAITTEDFELLKDAFSAAKENKVQLYDIMTERYAIINILQKELVHMPEVFGYLEKGTRENPAVIKESVHHFFKNVSGAPLIRPAWFFDVKQEGDGIVDVTTHFVDLIQWTYFPEMQLEYKKDVEMLSAKRWPTKLTLPQFKQVTQNSEFPAYLRKDVKDDILNVYANGEMNYTLKGIHAKVSVVWNYQAPTGTGDTHYSIMRGSKANLVIRQTKEQDFEPTLFIEPVDLSPAYEKDVLNALKKIQRKFPDVAFKKLDHKWEVVIPGKYKEGHESHFSKVTEKYLQYVKEGGLPDWEIPQMITKYYTTTQALDKAMKK